MERFYILLNFLTLVARKCSRKLYERLHYVGVSGVRAFGRRTEGPLRSKEMGSHEVASSDAGGDCNWV